MANIGRTISVILTSMTAIRYDSVFSTKIIEQILKIFHRPTL